ncbi:unnamed protein product [Linum tenue]|uniref:Transmembrane protein n=1 Tax=Linum tenue TaxID=586396 RepID=A0AAV0NLA0_9ROSI|nr:unnamed protein product [Linum tenue]
MRSHVGEPRSDGGVEEEQLVARLNQASSVFFLQLKKNNLFIYVSFSFLSPSFHFPFSPTLQNCSLLFFFFFFLSLSQIIQNTSRQRQV